MNAQAVVLWFAVLVGLLASTADAQSTELFRHEGAMNPLDEGWSRWTVSGFAFPVEGPVIDDLGQGIAAWSLDDDVGGFGVYRQFPTTQQAQDAEATGWRIRATIRVVDQPQTSGGSVNLFFRPRVQYSWQFALGVEASGELIVRYVQSGTSPTATLQGGNEYHDYELIYKAATGTADLYVDGKLIFQNVTHRAAAGADGFGWGDGAGADSGHAHYKLVTLEIGEFVAPQPPLVFWTDAYALGGLPNLGTVECGTLDGGGPTILVNTDPGVFTHDIAVDRAGGKIYWAQIGPGTIHRANLDGSGVETILGPGPGIDGPLGIALDTTEGKIYFADIAGDAIRSADLDGTNLEDLVTGLDDPFGIDLDLCRGKIYFTDRNTRKIQRANLDGSQVEDLVTTGLQHPYGIALDLVRGKMIWIDLFAQKIQQANLDGSNVEDLVAIGSVGAHFIELDLRAGKMYWTRTFGSSGPGRIERANLDGSDVEVVFDDIALPIGIAVDVPNNAPTAETPENLTISTAEVATTVISGAVSDADGDAMVCWWVEDGIEITDPVDGSSGACPLDLATLPPLTIGDHTLTLVVADGMACSTSSVVLTVENSPPVVAISGAGVYEIGPSTQVPLAGQVSDFEGDTLTYQWLRLVPCSGAETPPCTEPLSSAKVLAPPAGGDPVDLVVHNVPTQTLGTGVHVVQLIVDDGTNDPTTVSMEVEVVDTTAPTLSVTSSHSILWPPNHKMVEVTLTTDASDNSGGAVLLDVEISSSEPADGDGDGNTEPDYEVLDIDQSIGVIVLNLRAERSGKGAGRTYTIVVTATDSAGLSSSVTIEIVAPHSRGKRK